MGHLRADDRDDLMAERVERDTDVVLARVAEPGKHVQRLIAHGPDPRHDGVRVGTGVRQRHVDRVQHGQKRRRKTKMSDPPHRRTRRRGQNH